MATTEQCESVEKQIFMRARAGNINISFFDESEAKQWEGRIVSILKESGLKIKERK